MNRTPAQKAIQSARTKKNKRAKYEKLINERPNDPHRPQWENQIKNNT